MILLLLLIMHLSYTPFLYCHAPQREYIRPSIPYLTRPVSQGATGLAKSRAFR